MTEPDDKEELPRTLIAALKARELSADVITRRTDRELMAKADAHFGVTRPAPHRRAWAAVAAIAVLGIAVVISIRDPAPAPDQLYTDVDGSGRIDIADVLALARDGKGLAQSDIDAFAARIVRLDEDG